MGGAGGVRYGVDHDAGGGRGEVPVLEAALGDGRGAFGVVGRLAVGVGLVGSHVVQEGGDAQGLPTQGLPIVGEAF